MFLKWPAQLDMAGYRCVVVGAGLAGLHLAGELSRAGRVLVIEAGGTADPLDAGAGIYRLVSTARDYPELATRLSAFGGTSNHWGGNCHPLAPDTFADRAGFGRWPITAADLEPYLAAAGTFLNLRPFGEGPPSSIVSGVMAGHAELEVRRFQYFRPALRLGDPAHVARYAADPGIDILTDTRVTDIALSADTARVQSVTLLHRPSRETREIAPGRLVLAMGGIENARMLLWAGRKYPAGNPLLGGPNALTGTRFNEKPYFYPVDVFLDSRVNLTDAFPSGESNAHHAWELSAAFRARHGLPPFGVFARTSEAVPPDARIDLEAADRYYARQSAGYQLITPAFQFEQAPDPQSFVALTARSDDDGVPLAALNWQLRPEEIAAYRKAVLLFCGILSQKGMAKARLRPAFRADDWSGLKLGYCCHHLGTTRMAETAADGVVDPDCKVFGLDNLFVAGSSVFPTSDYINPTLSLVALAARLAAHLGES